MTQASTEQLDDSKLLLVVKVSAENQEKIERIMEELTLHEPNMTDNDCVDMVMSFGICFLSQTLDDPRSKELFFQFFEKISNNTQAQ